MDEQKYAAYWPRCEESLKEYFKSDVTRCNIGISITNKWRRQCTQKSYEQANTMERKKELLNSLNGNVSRKSILDANEQFSLKRGFVPSLLPLVQLRV